jgi:hypothetical protein
MKTICFKIKYAYLFEVDSISESNIVLKSGFSLKTISIIGNAIAEENSAQSPHGSLFRQNISGTFQTQTTDVRSVSNNPLIMLITFDNTSQVWGTLENPVRTNKIQSINDVVNFEFIRNSTLSEF